MAIIWCMVPEILSMTDRTFCHCGPFFAPLPPLQPKKSKFWKMKKIPGDIIILHQCTINDNHVMYGSWDMKLTDRFFCYLDHFLPLYLPNNPKNQNFEKLKKHLETLSFYTSVPKIMIICYNVSKIWCLMDVIVIFNFGLFSTLLPP